VSAEEGKDILRKVEKGVERAAEVYANTPALYPVPYLTKLNFDIIQKILFHCC
jgi:hypothetical protein